MLIKKESITSQKPSSHNFNDYSQHLSVFLYLKVSPLLFNSWEVFPLHLIRQSYLLKSFLRTPILINQVYLCLLSILELIYLTPDKITKIKTDLHFFKSFGLDCILVVVLKNCHHELSLKLAELFNVWRNLFSPDFWKVSSVVPMF